MGRKECVCVRVRVCFPCFYWPLRSWFAHIHVSCPICLFVSGRLLFLLWMLCSTTLQKMWVFKAQPHTHTHTHRWQTQNQNPPTAPLLVFLLQEFISICVRNPRLVKADRWHRHIDYEICLQASASSFRVRRFTLRRPNFSADAPLPHPPISHLSD